MEHRRCLSPNWAEKIRRSCGVRAIWALTLTHYGPGSGFHKSSGYRPGSFHFQSRRTAGRQQVFRSRKSIQSLKGSLSSLRDTGGTDSTDPSTRRNTSRCSNAISPLFRRSAEWPSRACKIADLLVEASPMAHQQLHHCIPHGRRTAAGRHLGQGVLWRYGQDSDLLRFISDTPGGAGLQHWDSFGYQLPERRIGVPGTECGADIAQFSPTGSCGHSDDDPGMFRCAGCFVGCLPVYPGER